MASRVLLALCVALALAISHAADVDEKDVLVLTPENFDDTIAKHEKVLVEFYAPWCGHCKALTPHYAEAATKLKTEIPEVALAKVDADAHKELGSKFGVSGFPTLKWFVKGKAQEYNGGRTADTIVSWIKKRMGPPTKALASTADFDKFKEGAQVVVVGFFDKPEGEGWKAFEETAMEIEDVELGAAHDSALHKHAGHKHGEIVLFKKFDEGKAVYTGEMDAKAIKDFILSNQLAYVTEFSPETSSKIFGSSIEKQILLFVDKEAEGSDAIQKSFTEENKKVYGKVVGVLVNSNTKQVMDFFGVTKESLPCVYAVKVAKQGGGMKKFKGPDAAEIKTDALSKFFSDFIEDKVKAHLKSEKEPEAEVDEHGVTTLVGTSFDRIVMDKEKDVLVEFYAPWCGHCKQLAPIYDKLGALFKDVPSVVIAKMDATANDPPESIQVSGFPTIKFFKAGESKVPMDFSGDRTVKGFKKFLKTNAGIEFKLKDKKKKAELAGDDKEEAKDEL